MTRQTFLSKLVGSFSTPAGDNPTVAMVEAAFDHHKLGWRYINCEVSPADLGDAVKGARAMGWMGFNCSLPHKVAVIPYLDGLGDSAAIMGAVNCVVRHGDRFIGENTDGKGFLASLIEVADPQGQSVVMFGAGGAARAIGVELALAGASQITIVNRDPKRGETLAGLLATSTPARAVFEPWTGSFAIPASTGIVINATSIGMPPQSETAIGVDLDTLLPGMVVADVIPNPPRTRFIRDAETQGCTAIDGLGMLVNQGVIGVKYWTGVDVSAAVMRAKLQDLFGI